MEFEELKVITEGIAIRLGSVVDNQSYQRNKEKEKESSKRVFRLIIKT